MIRIENLLGFDAAVLLKHCQNQGPQKNRKDRTINEWGAKLRREIGKGLRSDSISKMSSDLNMNTEHTQGAVRQLVSQWCFAVSSRMDSSHKLGLGMFRKRGLPIMCVTEVSSQRRVIR